MGKDNHSSLDLLNILAQSKLPVEITALLRFILATHGSRELVIRLDCQIIVPDWEIGQQVGATGGYPPNSTHPNRLHEARVRTEPEMHESDKALPPKTVSESRVVMSRQMMPDDANPWGYVHGGTIMKMVDEAAGSAAIRHTRMRVSTAAIDYMSFLHPIHVGDLVTVKASVNDVGRTSMEVGVRVEAENMLTGDVKYTSSCYLVMVALNEDGEPAPVPPIVPESPDERRRMAAAKIRRKRRRQLQHELKSTA